MTIPMPIAKLLELPELVVTGCDGGIEIVMLCSLPDEDETAAVPPASQPVKNSPEVN